MLTSDEVFQSIMHDGGLRQILIEGLLKKWKDQAHRQMSLRWNPSGRRFGEPMNMTQIARRGWPG